ncbi:MAG: 4-hydroxy-tetrahydrodipicolinate synthase [Magnetococcales bacterium]|nr:4-hydroxy-tetrahydrodipicolinate synthase [Magnetococcales bacterium]NGZ07320.1 4-hydroxy-tetrahydrodipicolinate synthase [Magnetococcales bacterium]
MSTLFEGVFTALITPFRNHQVDQEALKHLVEFQIANGVNGLVPCGTTGESATLSHEEHKEVIRLCVMAAAGRVKIIAGSGSNSTQETIELTRFAQQVGADGALLITPYYNKPGQEGLYQHYRAVAEQVKIPLVLYNVPGRTGVDLLPATVARLANTETIVGLKEATANMERASSIRKLCGDAITLLSGDDATFLPFLAVGGKGVISVSSNVAPAQMVALHQAWQKGDAAQARQIHDQLLDLNQQLFCETNPIPVKAAAHMLGLCAPEIRLPLTWLSEPNQAMLRITLNRLGLLAST